jgi:hypothetical protein
MAARSLIANARDAAAPVLAGVSDDAEFERLARRVDVPIALSSRSHRANGLTRADSPPRKRHAARKNAGARVHGDAEYVGVDDDDDSDDDELLPFHATSAPAAAVVARRRSLARRRPAGVASEAS